MSIVSGMEEPETENNSPIANQRGRSLYDYDKYLISVIDNN